MPRGGKHRNGTMGGQTQAHRVLHLSPTLLAANVERYQRKPDVQPADVGELTRNELGEIDAGKVRALAEEGLNVSAISSRVGRTVAWVRAVLEGKKYPDIPPYK